MWPVDARRCNALRPLKDKDEIYNRHTHTHTLARGNVFEFLNYDKKGKGNKIIRNRKKIQYNTIKIKTLSPSRNT